MQQQDFHKRKQELLRRYFSFLNPEQQNAVFRIRGPLLVLAGAGSGKTTVLVNRIANIILFGNAYHSDVLPENAEEIYREMCDFRTGSREELCSLLRKTADSPAPPHRVLCITFTNKAANEFKERLSSLLGEQSRFIWAGTFHSICVRILRRHIHRLGYSNSFTIYDEDDKKKLISSVMKELNIGTQFISVKNVIQLISKYKEKGSGPEEMEANARRDLRITYAARVYKRYQEEMQRSNALDFDDLILFTGQLFQNYRDVLEEYQDQFDYILVDEYQDTNPSQDRLVQMLAAKKQNVCVVGDDDQSIYSFRGATVDNILRFDLSFPGTTVIRLEQNYRSTAHILNAANAVISHNRERKGKNLWTAGEDGSLVHVQHFDTQLEEAGFIVSEIRKRVNDPEKPANYRDFAVLYRVTALSNTLEQAFVRNRVPYRICGGLRFNERREIKDVVAYLSVISNPADPLRLTRILNVPRRAIGDTTVAKISAIASAEGLSYFDVMEHAERYPELSKSAGKLISFTRMIRVFQLYAEDHSVEQLVRRVLDDTGYLEYLREEAKADGDDLNEREHNVLEFLSTAKLYDETAEHPTLSEFLEEQALVSDTDILEDDQNAVTLMTVHSAKGLEFPVVFIAGFEERLFPHQTSVEEGNIEEERRLAYVAITRAKTELFITKCSARMLYGRTDQMLPSRFLSEIPLSDRTVPRRDGARRSSNGFWSPSPREPVVRDYRKPAPAKRDAPAAAPPPPTRIFQPGDRVQHAFFGAGEILSAQPVASDVIYEIAFDNGFTKRIMGSFAKLIPQE